MLLCAACAGEPARSGVDGGAASSGAPTAGVGGNVAQSGAGAGGQMTSGGSTEQAGAGGVQAGAGGVQAGAGGAQAGAGSGGRAGQGPVPPPLDGCDVPVAHERANRALDALLLGFWNDEERYLNETAPTNGNVTGYWTYAQAFDALLDGVERTRDERYVERVRSFYDGRAERGFLVDYFDDETWMTLALLRAYDLTDEAVYLETAETIFNDIMLAWDTSCCGDYLGGIWWNREHEQKATASNAGPVIAGVRLAERTAKPQYFDFALRAYEFWMASMVNRETYAIFDHLSAPDGQRFPGSLTYNHGLMIGAALELYAKTGEAHYLEEAHGFGNYLVTVATRDSDAGPVLFDAIGNSCDGDCAAWKGVGYRYLALLFRSEPTRQAYRNVLVSSAEAIWTLARNPDTDFFATSWAGPAPEAGGIEEQGSATMALNIHAMLCGPAP
jgi:predicted alpha-1,6-mannanase (GH76 family)